MASEIIKMQCDCKVKAIQELCDILGKEINAEFLHKKVVEMGTGTDMRKFNQIRDILETNSIPYKYKTKNCNSTAQMCQYEILVHKKDAEKVKYLLNRR